MPFRFWERKCPHKAGAAIRKELHNLNPSPSFTLHICWENTQWAAVLDTPHTSFLLFPFYSTSFHHVLNRGSTPLEPGRWAISSILPLHSQPYHSCLSWSPLLSMRYYLITTSLACQFSLQPSNLHSPFICFIFWITLFSWVCCLTTWRALSFSALVIPSINHSTTTFTAINLLPVFQIKTHFSLPYVNTSNKHRLNVFHF